VSRNPVKDSLLGLDLQYTMHFRRLSDEDFKKKTKAEKVADALMGKKKHQVGSLGIAVANLATYVMTKRGWKEVVMSEHGHHVVKKKG
jgi:hypothetical protein